MASRCLRSFIVSVLKNDLITVPVGRFHTQCRGKVLSQILSKQATLVRNCSSNIPAQNSSSTADKIPPSTFNVLPTNKIKTKDLTMKHNISKHDFEIKLGQIKEWLAKNFLIKSRVTFTNANDNQSNMATYNKMVENIVAAVDIAKVRQLKVDPKQVSFEIYVEKPDGTVSSKKSSKISELEAKRALKRERKQFTNEPDH